MRVEKLIPGYCRRVLLDGAGLGGAERSGAQRSEARRDQRFQVSRTRTLVT